jgi:prevent-host-death family protein
MTSVGSYEAKTHLPKLLERVARGEKILITRHGRPVAMLVPAPSEPKRNLRDVIRRMKTLRQRNKLGAELSIRELINEGRRY